MWGQNVWKQWNQNIDGLELDNPTLEHVHAECCSHGNKAG